MKRSSLSSPLADDCVFRSIATTSAPTGSSSASRSSTGSALASRYGDRSSAAVRSASASGVGAASASATAASGACSTGWIDSIDPISTLAASPSAGTAGHPASK
ncbi:hypothetical protein G6F50_017372 [Rhizopus delemar]|uniref:Uncharacterized protein n=1 Tax=Rhizopus delemar TaxID=936053 RepID=A0A9P6XR79_9FUNG|nr:hypothetical protein G6F50_017372 [Rhizopus delemar]